MVDEEYQTSFTLIAIAGDSRADSMLAIKAAKALDFSKAEKLIILAEKKLNEAHGLQTSLIQREAGGEKVEVNIILVHSQDHLTMAMMAKDNAEEFISFYKEIAVLKTLIQENN